MAKQTGVIAPVDAMEKITKTGISTLKKIAGDIAKLKASGDQLAISGVDDVKGYKAVDEHRKSAKNIRTAIERKRKELNEPALKFQRDVNAVAKDLTELISLIEKSSEEKMKIIDDEKARIATALAQKISDRTNQLYKRGVMFNGTYFVYKDIIMYPENIRSISDAEWSQWITLLDQAIDADKIEEPIFPIEEIEPKKFVEPIEPEQPVEVKANTFPAPGIRMSNWAPQPKGNIPDDVVPDPVIEFTPTETVYKGMTCIVYAPKEGLSYNNQLPSSKYIRLLLTGPGVPELHTETNPERVVELEFVQSGATGAVTIDGDPVRIKVNTPIAKSLAVNLSAKGEIAFGGNFIYMNDPRFPSNQPIPIFDKAV